MIHVFYKQPGEISLFGIEMKKAIHATEALAASNANGALSLVVLDENGLDVTATIVETAPYINGTVIQFMVKAGSDGAVYTLQFKVPTSFGQVLEEDGILTVNEVKG